MPLASNTHHFEGSTLLAPVSALIGLSVDKVNFIAVQLFAIGLGYVFRVHCKKQHLSSTLRSSFHVFWGCLALWFCFGPQMIHMFVQSMTSYFIMKTLPRRLSGYLVLFFCMIYLGLNHIYRLYNDYSGYTLDITGPLMIQTQKITGLALSLLDGELISNGRHSELSEGRRKHAVRDLPSLLRYHSFTLFLPSLMSGPFSFYADFDDFFEERIPVASSMKVPVLKIMAQTMVWACLQLIVSPLVPYHWVLSDAFAQMSFFRKILYTTVAFFFVRSKYYFAWSLAEAANVSTGFGFSGFDERTKQPRYDLAKYFDLRSVEMGTNIRALVNGWNIPSHMWLRECIYERMSRKYATVGTFIASAVWHGFYPGYYCFFLTFAVFTVTGRRVRQVIRPHFQGHAQMRMLYEIITVVGTNLAQNYAQGVFFLLEMSLALRYWSSMFFFGHIVCGLLLFSLPSDGQPVVPKLLLQYMPSLTSCRQFIPNVPPFLINQYRQYFPGPPLDKMS